MSKCSLFYSWPKMLSFLKITIPNSWKSYTCPVLGMTSLIPVELNRGEPQPLVFQVVFWSSVWKRLMPLEFEPNLCILRENKCSKARLEYGWDGAGRVVISPGLISKWMVFLDYKRTKENMYWEGGAFSACHILYLISCFEMLLMWHTTAELVLWLKWAT